MSSSRSTKTKTQTERGKSAMSDEDGAIKEPEIDLEDGEIEESGGELSEAEGETKEPELDHKPKSLASGSVRVSKTVSTVKRKAETSSKNNKDSSRKSSKSGSVSSKRSDGKRSKFDEEKEAKRKLAKRKIKEGATFEDELNEYQQLNSTRTRSDSGTSGNIDGEHNGHMSPNSKRMARPPRPSSGLGGPPPRQFKRRKEEFRPKEKKVPCKFFMEGRCKYGDDCPFSHNIQQQKKLEACKFYMGGYCQKGPNCVYLHNEFPCKFYHTGQRCYAGDACKFSHDVLSQDQRMALDRTLEKENKEIFLRNQRHEFERQNDHGFDGPYRGQGEDHREAKILHDNLSHELVGPKPEDNNHWENNRRRPEFFRNTLAEDHGRTNHPVNEDGLEFQFDSQANGEQFQNVPPGEDIVDIGAGSQGVRSPEGSESSRKNSDASPDITRTLPRKQRELFMRLQQRVQQSNNKLADMESETEPLSAESQDEDGLRLKIEEPESSADPEKPSLIVTNSSWHDSDDEDEGNDQFLANSLKRLQEKPAQSRWSRPLLGETPQLSPPFVRSHPPFTVLDAPFHQAQSFSSDVQPYFAPPTHYAEFGPDLFPTPEATANRGKVLLPLPLPLKDIAAREPLLMPPSADFSQFPHPGGLLAIPFEQAAQYQDPNWMYHSEKEAQSSADRVSACTVAPSFPNPQAMHPQQHLLPSRGVNLGGPHMSSPPPHLVSQGSPFSGNPVSLHAQQHLPYNQNPGDYLHHPQLAPQNAHQQYLQTGQQVIIDPSMAHLYFPGPMGAPQDPRLQRVDMQSPSQDVVSPPPAGSGTPTLEAVLQKLAAQYTPKSNMEQALKIAEIEASLAKNIDPPLYRLEPIESAKPDMKKVYLDVCTYRTAEEMNKDPRITKFVQGLSAEDMEKLKGGSSATGGVVIPDEPSEHLDPKKASLEFDAVTALLLQQLGKSKKRESEEREGKSSYPVTKKIRRVVVSTPSDSYS